jgi:hypothetical protein
MATAEEVFRGVDEIENCLYQIDKRVQQCLSVTKGTLRPTLCDPHRHIFIVIVITGHTVLLNNLTILVIVV